MEKSTFDEWRVFLVLSSLPSAFTFCHSHVLSSHNNASHFQMTHQDFIATTFQSSPETLFDVYSVEYWFRATEWKPVQQMPQSCYGIFLYGSKRSVDWCGWCLKWTFDGWWWTRRPNWWIVMRFLKCYLAQKAMSRTGLFLCVHYCNRCFFTIWVKFHSYNLGPPKVPVYLT